MYDNKFIIQEIIIFLQNISILKEFVGFSTEDLFCINKIPS